MNRTNQIILLAIFCFIVSNFIVLNFGIRESPSTFTVSNSSGLEISSSNVKKHKSYEITIKNEEANNPVEADVFFNENPNFLLYLFFLTFFTSISLGVIFPLLHKTKKVLSSLQRSEVLWFSFLAAIITVGLFLLCNKIPHAWHPQSILEQLGIFLIYPTPTMITLLMPLLALSSICIFGIFGVSTAIQKTRFSRERKEESIEAFLNYKKILDEYVVIFGVLIATGAIVISSSLAGAVNNYFLENLSIHLVPKEFVYLYGLAFTAGIVIIYVPVYLKLRQIGEEMISEFNPMDSENLESWNKKNAQYLQLMGLELNVWDGLKTSLKVLSPLVASVLATMI